MDESNGQWQTAQSSSRDNVESVSKKIAERFGQRLKHSRPRLSTEDGMQIDESAEHCENVLASSRERLARHSNVNLKCGTEA
jgi:hypothetical protein